MSEAPFRSDVSPFGTTKEITSSIRHALPFAFAGSDAAETSRFREKYFGLSDFASKVAKSPLQRETTRYQTNLLYLSLIFVGVTLYRPPTMGVKLLGAITIDTSFMILFSLLIFAVGVIFLVKALLDYSTSQFGLTKDFSARDVSAVIMSGSVKVNIDQYYWLEIFEAIGETYQTYHDAVARASNSSPLQHISMKLMTLDMMNYKERRIFAI